MKLHWILCLAVVLIGIYTPCQAFPDAMPLQEFIESQIDIPRFKQEGFRSVNETTLQNVWSFFKTKFRRSYFTDEEDEERQQIFRDRLRRVLISNLAKKLTFRLALNQFADMTLDEFRAKKLGLRRVPGSNQTQQQTNVRDLLKLYHDRFHSRRRLKRDLYKKRNQHYKQRSFIDWVKHFRNVTDNDDSSSDSSSDSDGDNDNDNTQVPDSIDWRTKNVVTSVKYQGDCGSCYAFATVGVMESLYAIKTQSDATTDYSPQQIVDCSTDYENYGCNGGDFPQSANYLTAQNGQLSTEASYPYAGTQQQCKAGNGDQVDLGTIEYGAIPEGNEKKLAEALVQNGPTYIALNADSELLMSYESGVLKIDNCPNTADKLNHALVLVGYGYDNDVGESYWIIKNSWGTTWGEEGYLRLAKDSGNMCGVSSGAYHATLK